MRGLKYIFECMMKAVKATWSSISCGLDPGVTPGTTGYAILERVGDCVWVLRKHGRGSIEEALSRISSCLLVGVDSPIHPPYQGFRRVERKAMRIGARFLPGGSRGMRRLALLGYSIALYLCHGSSIPVETHPGSIRLLHGLGKGSLGFKDAHVEDAILSAIAAASAACGLCWWFIDSDGIICLPKSRPLFSFKDDIIIIKLA